MCRYGTNSYKQHYACFDCRKTFKRRLLIDIDGNVAYTKKWENAPAKCPECAGLMADMGYDFEAPKKTDIKAWQHMKSLYSTGITFHSCGCTGPGYIPKDHESHVAYLKEKRDMYAANLRFWSNRVEPNSEGEKQKDWDKNANFLARLPNSTREGTRKNRTVNLEKAVAFWKEKTDTIDLYLKSLQTN
uniref:hypothetical protein n=1 Tax=Roseivirga sp. TaxID=1964215 RepID=UPI0040488788